MGAAAELAEVAFGREGEGAIESLFGTLPFRRGDYLVIPIGTTYRLVTSGPTKLLVFDISGGTPAVAKHAVAVAQSRSSARV